MSDAEGEFIEVVPKRRRKKETLVEESSEPAEAPQPKKRGRPPKDLVEPPDLEPTKRGRPSKAAAPQEPSPLTREVSFQSSRGSIQFNALKKYGHLHDGIPSRRAHYESLFTGVREKGR